MKCHAFCACNKVVIDKDGAHSLIEIMLNAEIHPTLITQEKTEEGIPTSIPPNAVAPTQWWLYTQWEPTLTDVGKDFEQVFQVYWPNGDKFAENRLPFNLKDERMTQTSFSYVGFPVGQEGRLRLLTWLDQAGNRVTDLIESFVLMKHKPILIAPQAQVETASR
jgi:hypothetical protein